MGAPPLDDVMGDGPVSRGAPRGGATSATTSAAVAAQRLGGGRAGAGRPGASRGRGGPSLLARLGGRLPRIRPVKALTVGAFGVALVGIVANAMVFQRGHHPSPLFGLGRSLDGASDPAAQRAASGSPAAAPAPAAPAPIERTGTIPPAPAAADPAPPAAAAAASAPKPAAPVHHAAKAHAADPAERKTAAAHPRPGQPASAVGKADAKPETRQAARSEVGSGPKSDPLGKLIAGSARPAKAETKPTAAAHAPAKADATAEHRTAEHKPAEHKPAGAAEAAPAHPHRRLAAAAPLPKAPAAQAE